MEMPTVSSCDISQCAYNMDNKCHAMAITIGDGAHPACDTFCPSGAKGGVMDEIGRVGACKVPSCIHNSMLECQAESICVGYQGSQADCLTFEAM